MTHKAIVVDANILIRAVLGKRARDLIEHYAPTVNFLAPDVVFEDAHHHLPEILQKRGIASEPALAVLARPGQSRFKIPGTNFIEVV